MILQNTLAGYTTVIVEYEIHKYSEDVLQSIKQKLNTICCENCNTILNIVFDESDPTNIRKLVKLIIVSDKTICDIQIVTTTIADMIK